jgi:hypothetical protein
LLSLIIRSSVTSFNKFLLECNLDYWFLSTSYFVCVEISGGDYGCFLFSDWSLLLPVNVFYQR